MRYNSLIVRNEDKGDKHYTRRLLENKTWYSGIEQDIEWFYQREAPKFYRKGRQSDSLLYFWRKEDNEIRKIHSGFPQLISEKMVDLITSNGYEINIEGGNESELELDLEAILKDNKFKTMLLGKAIETESWSGGVAFKISFQPHISEYPIIETWNPENYEYEEECGRITKDIFYKYYEKGSQTYRLSEIYGVDDKGAYIDYKLERLASETSGSVNVLEKWVTVPFSELEETKELQRISFIGYFKKLSMYKPNKMPNSEFIDSLYGESDYSGSYGAFDAVDEILSTWIQEFRDSKLNRYFPEELVPTTKDGKASSFGKIKKDHIIYKDSPSDNVDKQKILYEQGEVRTDKHIESYKAWVTQILNNAGLSPLTVGITGLESIDSSAESQQEREKVSIRTRNKKAELWQEFLEEYLKTILEFYQIIKGAKKNANGVYNANKPTDFELTFTFNDYIIKSKADKTKEVNEGQTSSWDILSGIRYVHPNLTEQEQLSMSARLKLEQGHDDISLAEISALKYDDEANAKILQENKVTVLSEEEAEAYIKAFKGSSGFEDFDPSMFSDGEEDNEEEENDEE